MRLTTVCPMRVWLMGTQGHGASRLSPCSGGVGGCCAEGIRESRVRTGVKGLTLKVSKQWMNDFNTVMEHHQRATPYTFGDSAIEECKAEAREHEAWALEFYPRAAAQIREMQQ